MTISESSDNSISKPLISIVIPTRNEQDDIAATLERCLAMVYDPKECIVVDDSTDGTPEIVARYAERGVCLIHRDVNRNGCCGARNVGMQAAHGEIIVLMNADDRPAPDFLERVCAHYAAGADYLVVRSEVHNKDNPWAEYLHAQGQVSRDRQGNFNPLWSEGFSCRRIAAETVGYIPGDYPVPFCRDNSLGRQLAKAGFNKHYDPSIIMEHVSPDRFSSFWRNQIWRGTIAPPYNYYMEGKSLWYTALRQFFKTVRTILLDILVLPLLWRTYKYSKYTPGGWRRFASMLSISIIQDTATIRGNFIGTMRIFQARKYRE